MINGADLSGNVAFDANSLNSLKQAAKENSPEAIKAVAKQFEAIFMNMMLKSMREATPQDNPFDSEQSRTFTSMLDQQLSSNLATKGLGLADVLAKQLSKTSQAASSAMEQAVSNVGESIDNATTVIKNTLSPDTTKTLNQKTNPVDKNSTLNKLFNDKSVQSDSNEFRERMTHHAKEASQATGVPAHLMLGQAALETGWGKREIKGADGMPSYNLFGIKASGNWSGKVVEAMTTEYINGVKQKRIEKFRAYDSYADSFKDFAKLMTNNPRYEKVIANLNNVYDYAQAMQKAGYATDPNYATKLTSVIKKFTSL
jgi:peptidoglycan hydrolase FlgJ